MEEEQLEEQKEELEERKEKVDWRKNKTLSFIWANKFAWKIFIV